MTMTVRTVRMDELDRAFEVIKQGRQAIKKLNIDQWQLGVPSKTDIEKDIELNRLWAAYDEQGICAVAAFCENGEPFYDTLDGKWLTDGPYLTVHRMAAATRARHTGAAQTLLQAAEKIAKEKGFASVRLDTHRGNVVMQRFATKNGYANCGIVDYKSACPGDSLRIGYEKIVADNA